MNKYIDSEKLIAEIIQRKDWYLANADKIKNDDTDLSIFYEGRWQMCDDVIAIIDSLQQEQPLLPSNLDEAAEEYAQDETMSGLAERAFKAGAEWQREQYECIPAEEEYMRGFAQGAKEERKDLTPLINRLCEAILFEWKDAADLARKILTQIKAREG